MGYRVKPFTMAVRDNSTQQFIDVGLLGSDVESDVDDLKHEMIYHFDTVADMKAGGLDNGMYVQTGGYYAIDDAGGALYRIENEEPTTFHETLNNGKYARLIYGSVINVRQFGAKGDEVADDTDAIQAAFNACLRGGTVYFPKNGTGKAKPSYRITRGLYLNRDCATIQSDASSEYNEGIVVDNRAITILTVQAAGVNIRDMHFRCIDETEAYTDFTQTNGIKVDRSVYGNAETYSNIDFVMSNCWLTNLNDGLKAKGRNVTITNCVFSNCKRGIVGEYHYYNNGADISEFRGYLIKNNRFHSIGNPLYQIKEVIGNGNYPTTLDEMDCWCIEMPTETGITSTASKIGFIVIKDNEFDLCNGGFYKGFLSATTIQNNTGFMSSSMFVYSKCVNTTDAIHSKSGQYRSFISDNALVAWTPDSNIARDVYGWHNIWIKDFDNIVITNNMFKFAGREFMVFSRCANLTVSDNDLVNGNRLGTLTSSYRPGISVEGTSRTKVTGNKIISQLGSPTYSYGYYFTNGVSKTLTFKDNHVEAAQHNCSIDPQWLVSSDSEGLEWQTPTMLNSFVLDSNNSLGYRRKFDGTVEVSIVVSGGTDNGIAFQLPLGYRPKKLVVLPASSVWNAVNETYVVFNANGDVIVNYYNGTIPQSGHQVHIHAIFVAA